MAENVMSHFAALEADQQVTGLSRRESDVPMVTPQLQSEDEERETQTSGGAGVLAAARSQQEAIEEMVMGYQHGREEHNVMPPTSSVDMAAAPDTLPILPAWPRSSSGQGSSQFYTPYDTQGFRAPNTP